MWPLPWLLGWPGPCREEVAISSMSGWHRTQGTSTSWSDFSVILLFWHIFLYVLIDHLISLYICSISFMHLFSHLLTVKLIKLMNGHMNAEYIRGLCVNCVSFLNDCEKEKMKSWNQVRYMGSSCQRHNLWFHWETDLWTCFFMFAQNKIDSSMVKELIDLEKKSCNCQILHLSVTDRFVLSCKNLTISVRDK